MVDIIVCYLVQTQLSYVAPCIYLGKLYTKMAAVNLRHTSLVP